ncbi:heme ABC transporter ATP-binding protein [Myroides sp. LJL119]
MIQATKINFKYKEHYLINGIDFSCEKSELIAVIGPNGAGKSTFLNLLANEVKQKGNEILFKTCHYDNWCHKELPKHKAKFSQANSTDIPLSVEQVVTMGRYPYFQNDPSNTDKQVVEESMKCLDICKYKHTEYNHLSGGEKQRVHLARVLAQLNNNIENKLLFLDEPLNNLDVLHQHKILNLLKDFTSQGNTAIVIIHDLNLASQYADKILLLDKGSKVSYDKPQEVLQEHIITKVYQLPCVVTKHPLKNNPLILFG